MAQFGAIYACRESFVPLSPPRSRAGRILYRTRGRVGASHDTTTGTTSAEGTGATTGPRCSTRGRRQGQHGLAGPAWVGRTTATQISHAIRLVQISTNEENAAIPTMQIQCLNKLLGNYMRNCCADRPGRGAARHRRGRQAAAGPGRASRRDTETTPHTFRT